ncbi:MAG: hypothetical protein J7578_11180 [Chitinophagaceae bacterium]|nr:hypothetical protein [Chitinophagaceae bacterium]
MKKITQAAIALSFIVCIFLFASCYKSSGDYQSPSQTPTQTVVKYTISSSSGNVTVIYTDKNGQEVTVNNVPPTWTFSFTADINNQTLKLTVIGMNNTVTVGGTISFNGHQIAQNSSTSGTVTVTTIVDRMHAGY